MYTPTTPRPLTALARCGDLARDPAGPAAAAAVCQAPAKHHREGLGPTGRYCLSSGEGPKIADRFKPRSQEDEWHLPHLDDLRERHEARRGYWAEEGLERFAEHRDRIAELTDAAHDAHERARWDRDERAHNRAVAMDVFAEKEREDWAKMEEELAHLLDRDRLAERGQSDLAISSAEERMRWDMEERRKRMAEAAARA